MGVVTDDNGLYYMRARYYNLDIKRFINQDILTGNIGNNASLNRYSYVEGNPVSYTDPFGLAPFDFVTDKIDVSTIIHVALDILGTLPYGDNFGKMGTYVENPNIKVDWSQYAEHGLERMQQRGMQEIILKLFG